jgi:hypothetical protein
MFRFQKGLAQHRQYEGHDIVLCLSIWFYILITCQHEARHFYATLLACLEFRASPRDDLKRFVKLNLAIIRKKGL